MDATGTTGVQQQIDGLPEAAQQHWQLILAHARSEPLAEAEALRLLHVCLEQETTGIRLEWGSVCAGKGAVFVVLAAGDVYSIAMLPAAARTCSGC